MNEVIVGLEVTCVVVVVIDTLAVLGKVLTVVIVKDLIGITILTVPIGIIVVKNIIVDPEVKVGLDTVVVKNLKEGVIEIIIKKFMAVLKNVVVTNVVITIIELDFAPMCIAINAPERAILLLIVRSGLELMKVLEKPIIKGLMTIPKHLAVIITRITRSYFVGSVQYCFKELCSIVTSI